MDLSTLTADDLRAIQKGDLSSVSEAGLRVIAGKPRSGKSFDLVDGKPVPTGSPEAKDAQDPTSGMSGLAKFGAGYGKAGMDLARGAGQLVGLESRQDVQDARDRDAPLMNTGAGKVGNFAGSIADLAPAAFVPGANTLAGAAGIGALGGLLQPSTSTGETAANVGLGGVAGPASLLTGRAVGALGKGLKASLWDPFTQPGQQRIAANVLQNFAGGPQSAAEAAARLAQPVDALPGVTPTTAELAGNGGLAQLQKTLSSNNIDAFTKRAQANHGAMQSAIENIAGSPEKLDAATQARNDMAEQLYGDARKQGADAKATAALNARLAKEGSRQALEQVGALQKDLSAAQFNPLGSVGGTPNTAAADSIANRIAQAKQTAASLADDSKITGKGFIGGVDVSDLLERPSLASAINGATRTAADFGQRISSANPVQVLHYAKMNLDGQINAAVRAGNNTEAAALSSAKQALLGRLEQISPTYRQASQTYATMSQPINQMQVGQALKNKLLPSLADYGANGSLNGATFATGLRNGDQVAANVTGRAGASLSDILTAQQMKTVKQIGEQLARADNAAKLGAAKGSPTAQNLIAQNVLGQFLGPFGLPNNMAGRAAGSALSRSIMHWPGKALYSAVEPDVMQILSQAALDPKVAQGLLTATQRPGLGSKLWNRQGLLGTSTNAIGQGLLRDSRDQ
jgi:hypothetical protein